MIVLASTSPRRAELLRAAGYDLEIVAPGVVEDERDGETPAQAVVRLARLKAGAVERPPGFPVLGADTVVEFAGQALGKPVDDDDARRMLTALSGSIHAVHTGFCIRYRGAVHTECVTTRVRFRPLSPEEIDAYVATGEPRDKAGAYGIQDAGGALVEEIQGSFDNVVGLPVQEVTEALRLMGYPDVRKT